MLIQENNHNNKLCISGTTLICCIINTQSASTFVVSLHLKLVLKKCKDQAKSL